MDYTQEQIDNRSSDYVCFDCGHLFLTDTQKKGEGHAVTAHKSNCGLCGQDKSVTHIRAFNYLKLKHIGSAQTE